jgi:cytochrome c6
MMNRIDFRRIITLGALNLMFVLPAMNAQDAAATYKAKCAGCHGADGTGSAMGKKMGVHDFTSADIQKMSDEELSDVITNGRNKMPKFPSLKPEEVKELVAYIRAMKK